MTCEFNNGRSVSVSSTTVPRALKEVGLFGRVAARKPLLREDNRKAKLAFAKKTSSLDNKRMEQSIMD